MEFLFGGVILAMIGSAVWGFIVVTGIVLGFPMESTTALEKRQRVAHQIWQDQVEAQAARNVALRAAEKHLEGV